MSTYDYTKAVATAKRLIERFGEDCQVDVPTVVGASAEPWKGLTVSVQTTTVKAVFFESKRVNRESVTIRKDDGQRLNEQRSRNIIAYMQGDVVGRSTVTRQNGISYRIRSITTMNPGSLIVYHKVELDA